MTRFGQERSEAFEHVGDPAGCASQHRGDEEHADRHERTLGGAEQVEDGSTPW